MTSFLSLVLLVSMVTPPAILNIIAYPISHSWSMGISNYINKVCAPRLFAILKCYKNFNFWGYKETKKNLPPNFIVISNHQSLLDIPVFMNFFSEHNVRFVAKDTLSRHIPLVSEMLRTQEHCMTPRSGKPMKAMKLIDDFSKRVVERNQVPILFPEGSRTKDGNVGKFYSAGFRRLAEGTGLPVVVCALDGGYDLRDLGKIFRKLRNGCYRVKVLKVFDNPKTKEAQSEVLEESKKMIQEQLDEWRKLSRTEKYSANA